ncbi:MAG: hypothetical protein AVDCRST_MAG85-2908, partial [uncultured Solirubrobacteraceae bacterium]
CGPWMIGAWFSPQRRRSPPRPSSSSWPLASCSRSGATCTGPSRWSPQGSRSCSWRPPRWSSGGTSPTTARSPTPARPRTRRRPTS